MHSLATRRVPHSLTRLASRCRAALWLGLRPATTWFLRRPADKGAYAAARRPPSYRPVIEQFEERDLPNDLMGLASLPLLGVGLALAGPQAESARVVVPRSNAAVPAAQLGRGLETTPQLGASPLKFDRPLPSLSIHPAATAGVASPAARVVAWSQTMPQQGSDLWQQTQVSADGLFRDPLADDLPSGEGGRAFSPDAGPGGRQGSPNFGGAGAAPAASTDHASAPPVGAWSETTPQRASPSPAAELAPAASASSDLTSAAAQQAASISSAAAPASATAPKTAAASPLASPTPTVEFTQSVFSASEGQGSASVTVSLSTPSSQTVTVNYQASNGTAVYGTDYNGGGSGTLTFAPGVTGSYFVLNVLDDNLANETSPETVNLSLSSPTGATLGTPNTAVLDINEDSDSSGPTVEFTQSVFSASEGQGQVSVTVMLSAPSGQTVTVNYQVSDGTAVSGTDYNGSGSGTLTFAPGVTGSYVVLNVLDDNFANETSPETVNLSLSSPTGATLGTPNAAVLDINEDSDGGQSPTVQFSQATYSVTEGTTPTAVISVTLSAPTSQTVMVSYQTQLTNNDTAVAGQDFQAVNGMLSFTPGSTSASFSVPLLDDNNVGEPSTESLHLSLSAPTGAVFGAPASAALYLTEDGDANLGPANDVAISSTNCGCIDHSGDLVQTIAAALGPIISAFSAFPVRYADGVVNIAETDLRSAGFGFPWAQTRSWTNGANYATGGVNGNGWVDTDTPHLIQADGVDGDTLVVISNGTTARYYDLVNGVYQPRFDDPSQLTYNGGNDTYTLVDGSGDQIVFSGFGGARPVAQRGEFASFTAANGVTMAVTSYTADGHVAEVQRSAVSNGATITESFLYAYVAAGVNAGLLSGVTLRRQVNGGAWSVVRQVQYAYYDGTQTYGGNVGDLMTASVLDGANNVLTTSYYRYYTPGQPNGYTDGLHYVFNPTSYLRLTSALGTNLSNLTDAQVAPYADNAFQYDAQRRVTQEVVQGAGSSADAGGLGTFGYAYTASGNTPGYDTWAVKTVVTNPDGGTDTVYTNAFAEVMLDDHYDPASGLHWDAFTEYNNHGQLILSAAPSAVTGYNDAYGDLLNNQNGAYQYLNNTSGLITLYDYYTGTTATETTAGGVAGYAQDVKIEQGQQGTPVLQETWQYYAHAFDGQTVAPVATDTVYRNADGTGAETTSFAYTWVSNTAEIQSQTVSAPVVSAAENGPGAADVTTTFFDAEGRPVWVKDADGFIDYLAYDTATGAMTTSIVDVNTADSGEFVNLPSGWTTPNGGGLNLVTQDVVDALGRATEETSPAGNVTYWVYLDAQYEVRVYAGWDAATGLPTGPTEVVRHDPSGYDETLTMTATPHLTNGVPDGTEAIGGLQTLSRAYENAAGQVTAEDDYFNLANLTYSTALIGALGVNFYQTQYAYDNDGRPYQTETGNGTLYQTLYDSLGRPVSDWVGTSTANLVQVAAYVYDDGGVGDGNLTEETDYPGGGAAARVTLNWYDWRDRPVATKSGVQADENDGTNRPILYITYDNLDEAVEVQQYEGDGVTIATVNGVPQAPAANLLRAQEVDSYDDQGRVYQTQVFDVDPTTGAVSSTALTTNDYYDHRGDLAAESDPGGLWSKSVFDGAGRDVMDYTTDGAGGVTWAAALGVANDTVFVQTQTVFDGDSNVIETIDSQRFDNAVGLGPLGTPTEGVGARVYYAAAYYDNADRLTATVDVGTNGGVAWTRPATPPTPSDTALVTGYVYDVAGWVQDVIDPLGINTRTLHDALGRTTETIQNYTGAAEGPENDVATEYTYDGDNNVVTVMADEPGGAYQMTQYVYGVSTASGSAVNSYDILSMVMHPDPTTGNPSASQEDTYTVNALGQVTSMTDRNGNVHQYTYDVLGRLTSDAVTTLGAGVDGSVRRIEYAYDSQGNPYLITSYDSATGGNIVNQVLRQFDGLGQLTAEYQSHNGPVNVNTTPAVLYAYTEMAGGANDSLLTSMTYPSGYVVNYVYDSVSRLTSLSDSGGGLESYKYLGLDTVVERDHPQSGVDLTYISQTGQTGDAGDQYTGLDRFGRVVEQNWYDTATATSTDDFKYGYDRDSNVLSRQNVLDSIFSEGYTYDNLNQLTSFSRGSHTQSWTPDALGNFTSVTTDGTTQTRTANQQNEITSISGAGAVTYDANGNLTADGSGNTLVYDAWNRLVAVTNNGTTVASYGYNGLGERITETHGATTVDLYFSAAGQVLEERVGGTAQARNVWSPVYVNALVLRDQSSQQNGVLDQRLYVQQDANWNVTAITDASGNVLERYVYDPYGAVTVLTATWGTRGSSAYGWLYFFQGGRYDAATGQYHFGYRDWSPTLMRFDETDPLGLGPDNNDYRPEGDNPINATDPSGQREIRGNQYGSWEFDQQNTDGQQGVAMYRSHVRITFKPNAKNVDGKIVFVQVMRTIDTATKKLVEDPSMTEMNDREGDMGFALDRTRGHKFAWYGYENDGTPNMAGVTPGVAGPPPMALPALGASTVGLLGSPPGQGPLLAASALIPGRVPPIRWKAARMVDNPGWDRPNTKWEFETVVMAKEGPDAGKVYAAIHWGFTADAQDHVTSDGVALDDGPDIFWTSAVSRWNSQAAGKTWHKNCGDQAPLWVTGYDVAPERTALEKVAVWWGSVTHASAIDWRHVQFGGE